MGQTGRWGQRRWVEVDGPANGGDTQQPRGSMSVRISGLIAVDDRNRDTSLIVASSTWRGRSPWEHWARMWDPGPENQRRWDLVRCWRPGRGRSTVLHAAIVMQWAPYLDRWFLVNPSNRGARMAPLMGAEGKGCKYLQLINNLFLSEAQGPDIGPRLQKRPEKTLRKLNFLVIFSMQDKGGWAQRDSNS